MTACSREEFMYRFSRLALGALLTSAAACSSGSTENGNPINYPADPGTAPVQAALVEVQDNFFNPASVVLAIGGTVTWRWVGGAGHSVTPQGSTTFSPTAPVSYPPKDLVVTIPTAGTYNYLCTVHGASDGYGGVGSMYGTVTVR
jgi:plastocyanin